MASYSIKSEEPKFSELKLPCHTKRYFGHIIWMPSVPEKSTSFLILPSSLKSRPLRFLRDIVLHHDWHRLTKSRHFVAERLCDQRAEFWKLEQIVLVGQTFRLLNWIHIGVHWGEGDLICYGVATTKAPVARCFVLLCPLNGIRERQTAFLRVLVLHINCFMLEDGLSPWQRQLTPHNFLLSYDSLDYKYTGHDIFFKGTTELTDDWRLLEWSKETRVMKPNITASRMRDAVRK